ncbi:MAG: enolase C-terminal domain-like protein [Candidatus Latescibacterota bacterium]
MDELSQHIIADVSFKMTERHYPRPIGWNAQIGPHGRSRKINTCTLTTNKGASGWGYCGDNEDEIRAFVGRPITDLFHLILGTTLEARCIDIALHDLAGNILGLPVWKMLGGTNNRIPIYTGAIYFDDLNPKGDDPGLDAVLASCAQDAEAGFTNFKLKIGRGFKWMEKTAGDARDIEVTKLVREHYPDAKILVDANDGYDPDGIGGYLDAVSDCDLYWVEEPFTETVAGLVQLRAKLQEVSPNTLIADGEARNGRLQDPPGFFGKWEADHIDELYDLCERKLLDVILPDVGAMGFTPWRHMMRKLIEIGGQGSPHAWSEPFKSWYAAQIGCAYGHVPIVEGVPGYVDGVDDSGYVVENGVLTLPDKPGFGMDLVE